MANKGENVTLYDVWKAVEKWNAEIKHVNHQLDTYIGAWKKANGKG